MKTPNIYLALFLFLSSFFYSFAQKEASHWFVTSNHINFNGAAAPTRSNSQVSGNIVEKNGSIADKNGNLLIYCDGRTVYNKNLQPMPNGVLILRDLGNLTMGTCLIVPNPTNPFLYYVFLNDNYTTGLSYSIVDMRLNNGLGDVTQKNIPLIAKTSGGLAATLAADCQSYWVLARDHFPYRYVAYKIDANGVNTTPVITPIEQGNLMYDLMKFSPDGTKVLAFEWLGNNTIQGFSLLLYDFDSQIGRLINKRIILDNLAWGEVEFSPDSKKIYLVRDGVSRSILVQYDLEAINIAASALALPTPLPNSEFFFRGGLQLACNGKIYALVKHQEIFKLNVIDKPNERGIACNYQTTNLSLGEAIFRDFYPQFPIFPSNFAGGTNKDFTFKQACNTMTINFAGTSPNRYERYSWDYGDGKNTFTDLGVDFYTSTTHVSPVTHTYTQAGTYLVKVKIGSCEFSKTITVLPATTLPKPDSLLLCANESKQLSQSPPTPEGGVRYAWSPATGLSNPNISNPMLQLDNQGDTLRKITYKLLATNLANGCKDSTTLKVSVAPALKKISAGKDTTICSSQSISLVPKSPPTPEGGVRYMWSPATNLDSANKFNPLFKLENKTNQTQKLTYILTATRNGCSTSDTVVVSVLPKIQVTIAGSTQVCPFAKLTYKITSPPAPEGGVKPKVIKWQVSGGTFTPPLGGGGLPPVGVGGLDSLAVSWGAANENAFVKVWLQNALGCVDSTTLAVRISPQAVPTVDFGGENRKICFGQVATLGTPPSGGGGLSYQWTFADSRGLRVSSNNLAMLSVENINPTNDLLKTTAYVFVRNQATGCEYKDSVNLQLYPKLAVKAQKDTTICSGVQVQLSTVFNPNYQYEWKPATNLQNTKTATPTFAFVNTTKNTQIFDYQVIASWDSCQVVDKVQVTVLPQVPRATIKGSQFVCPNVEKVSYVLDSVAPNSQISWGVRGGKVVATQRPDSVLVDWGNSNAAAEIVAKVRAASGCVDSFKLAVQILPELRPAQPKGTSSLCWQPDNLQIYTTSFTNGSVYEWQVEGGTLQSPQGKSSMAVRWNSTGKHRIWVTETSTTRTDVCKGISPILEVVVLPTPEQKTISGATEVCENEVSSTYNYGGESSSKFLWAVQGGEILTGQGTNQIEVGWKNATANATIQVQETNLQGCKGKWQEQKVVINTTENCLLIPTLVSSTDQNYPFWKIKNIEKYPINGVVLYNVLGQLVLQKDNYQNTFAVSHLAAGVYLYKVWVQAGAKKLIYQGKLVVVK